MIFSKVVEDWCDLVAQLGQRSTELAVKHPAALAVCGAALVLAKQLERIAETLEEQTAYK